MHNTPRIRQSLKKGFTLVELLIVIIIIAILAAIVVPKFADSGLRSKEAALKSNLKLLRNAVELFKADTAAYPANLNDLAATTPPASGLDQSGNPKPISAANYRGPYVQAVPNDPVSGNPFNYSTTAPTVGRVTSSASGTATDGTNYSDW
jgi:general secretion pathway protein G